MLDTNFSWPQGKTAAVSLTFDDARASQLEIGLPILNKHGIPATFYILLGGLEAELTGWREAVAAGHELGNHTLKHPCSCNHAFSRANPLEDYTLERIEDELQTVDERLRELFGARARSFAYPCGQTFVGRGAATRSYVPLIAERYAGGRASGGPANDPQGCDLAQLTGWSMDRQSADVIIRQIESAAADGRWLILVAHDVKPDATQGMEPGVLAEVCAYLRSRPELWAGTVAEISQYLRDSRVS